MNPFKYGKVVSLEDFCPRPDLEKQLTEHILSCQNILLIGERRIGKTSLIFETIRKLRKFRFLYIDFLEIKTIEDLCQRIINALVSFEKKSGFLEKILKTLVHLKPSIAMDPITGSPAVSFDISIKMKPAYIEGLMDLIQSESEKRNLIVAFDEFQDIQNLAENFKVLALLRSKIQFHKNVSYVFAGSVRSKLNEMFNHHESPFFKSAIALNIGPLDYRLFTDFLIDKFNSGKRKISQETIDNTFKISNDNPGDIQQMCSAIWEITSYKTSIENTIIPKALELIFCRESKIYESYINLITSQQLNCLKGLAKKGGKSPFSTEFLAISGIKQPSSVKKSLLRLNKLRIIYFHEKEYKFLNPFFKAWLLNKLIK